MEVGERRNPDDFCCKQLGGWSCCFMSWGHIRRNRPAGSWVQQWMKSLKARYDAKFKMPVRHLGGDVKLISWIQQASPWGRGPFRRHRCRDGIYTTGTHKKKGRKQTSQEEKRKGKRMSLQNCMRRRKQWLQKNPEELLMKLRRVFHEEEGSGMPNIISKRPRISQKTNHLGWAG